MSYPRTDCPYISSDTVADFRDLLNAVACIPSLKEFVQKVSPDSFEQIKNNKQYVNDAELAESGHSALTPTEQLFDYEKLNGEEKNILTMIYMRFLAIFFPPLVEERTVVLINNNGSTFKVTGKVTKDKGFMEIFKSTITDTPLPLFEKGDAVHVKEHKTRDVTSKPPQRFTEGTLILAMENTQKYLDDASFKETITRAKGMGTSATRAEIIKKIIKSKQ